MQVRRCWGCFVSIRQARKQCTESQAVSARLVASVPGKLTSGLCSMSPHLGCYVPSHSMCVVACWLSDAAIARQGVDADVDVDVGAGADAGVLVAAAVVAPVSIGRGIHVVPRRHYGGG